MVVIMVDYSKPWEIIERLEHWVKVLSHHLDSLDLKESRQVGFEGKFLKLKSGN